VELLEFARGPALWVSIAICVLGDRGGQACHTLCLHSVAVREIAVGRCSGERQCGGGERHDAFESHVSSLDPDVCLPAAPWRRAPVSGAQYISLF